MRTIALATLHHRRRRHEDYTDSPLLSSTRAPAITYRMPHLTTVPLRSTFATVDSLTGEPSTSLTPSIQVPPLRHCSSHSSPPPSPLVTTRFDRCHRRHVLGIPCFGDGLPAHGGVGQIGWASQFRPILNCRLSLFPKIYLNQFI
jgi:hypothetical protein